LSRRKLNHQSYRRTKHGSAKLARSASHKNLRHFCVIEALPVVGFEPEEAAGGPEIPWGSLPTLRLIEAADIRSQLANEVFAGLAHC